MQRFVVFAAAIIATVGTASARSVTPAGCSTCILDAQLFNPPTTPFTLINLGAAIIQNSRQPIDSPVTVSGETIAFPATGSGIFAGDSNADSPFHNPVTNYLAAQPGDSGVAITFATPQRELDLLWGTLGVSPVFRDQVRFVFSDGSTGIVLGDDVFAAGIGSNRDATVEITTTKSFTTVIFTAGALSFEFVPGIPVSVFVGIPGKPNCYGQSVSALSNQYGRLGAAATALDYSSVAALQNAIMTYCGQ
jgi:hypothetical protein